MNINSRTLKHDRINQVVDISKPLCARTTPARGMVYDDHYVNLSPSLQLISSASMRERFSKRTGGFESSSPRILLMTRTVFHEIWSKAATVLLSLCVCR